MMAAVRKGSGSSFVPRDLLHPPESFGHDVEELEPSDPDPRLHRQVEGAQLQHLAMAYLRLDISRDRKTIRQVANNNHMSADRLYRMLRGESMMQITDLVAFGREFPRVRVIVELYLSDANVKLDEVLRIVRLRQER